MRPKRDNPRDNPKREWDDRFYPPPSPFSVPIDKVKALLQEWNRDGNINLPYVPRAPTARRKQIQGIVIFIDL